MKRLNAILIASLLLAFTSLQAQSFCKQASVADIRFGLSLYHTQSYDKITGENKTGSAACKTFSMNYEYGLMNWFGLGLRFQLDNYFVGKDTLYDSNNVISEIVKPSVKSYDVALTGNAHFLRKDHVDLFAGIGIGMSGLTYRENDNNNSQASGTGLWYEALFGSRFYFGKHIGINVNLGFDSFNYPKVNVSGNSVSYIDAFKLTGGGVSLSAGFQFRFGKQD